MNQQLLFNDLAKLLKMSNDEINLELNLKTHSYWDSLSIISLIGAIDDYYHVSITGEELMQAVVVADICNMISAKINLRV